MELKVEVEQEADKEKREIIIALIDWFFVKMDEWQQKRKQYKTALMNWSKAGALMIESLIFSNVNAN